MKHEGALSIYADEKLLLELRADGSVVAGEQFTEGENAKLVFRALALKYPRWAGDMIAAYVRALPLLVSSRMVIVGAVGGPVATDMASRVYRAVLEEVAMRAEENGQEAEAREAERQREQFRADKETADLVVAEQLLGLASGPNGADPATSA
jgi:hypothetical protein